MMITQLLNVITAIIYSLIPALLGLWYLVARRPAVGNMIPLVSFCLGATLAVGAGYVNEYTALNLGLGFKSNEFFLTVGLVEETIKLAACLLALLVAYLAGKQNALRLNWMAVALGSALGFAAAENLFYGINGQGSVARVVPLLAHACFGLLYGWGLLAATLDRSGYRRYLWVALGYLEAVAAHAIYDVLVGNEALPVAWKLLAWCGLLISAVVLYVLKRLAIERLSEDSLQVSPPIAYEDKQDRSCGVGWTICSVLSPGLGHLLGRREPFTGLTFLALALVGVYLVLRFGAVLLSEGKDPIGTDKLVVLIAVMVGWYAFTGLWSAWELHQRNLDLLERDRKRRLSAIMPVSTLMLASISASFLLPQMAGGLGSSQGGQAGSGPSEAQVKDKVVREISVGSGWNIDIVHEAPESPPQVADASDREVPKIEFADSDSLESEPSPEATKPTSETEADEDGRLTPRYKSKGVGASETNDPGSALDEKPAIGYVGIRVSETTVNGSLYPLVLYVFPGTSAYRSKLAAGDVIYQVDGRSTTGMTSYEVSKLIRGPLGTRVRMTVYRPGEGRITVTAKRTGALFDQ